MMKRGIKCRNAGTWTESDFNSHIISGFRDMSMYWLPGQNALKAAKVSRGLYQCEVCYKVGPQYLPPLPGKKRKRNNAVKDHIEPVVCPENGGLRKDGSGKMDWNAYVDRLYIEKGYRITCWECHSKKTKEENTLRRKNK